MKELGENYQLRLEKVRIKVADRLSADCDLTRPYLDLYLSEYW